MNTQQHEPTPQTVTAGNTLLTGEAALSPARLEFTHRIRMEDGTPVQGGLEICFLGEKFSLRPGQAREFKGVSLHFSFALTSDCCNPGLSVNVEEIASLHATRPGLRTIPLAIIDGQYEVREKGVLRLAAPADIEIALLGPDYGSSLTGHLRMRITGETGKKLKSFLGDWLQKTEHVQIRTALGGD